MSIPPSIWLNGRALAGTAAAPTPVLAPVQLTWGSDTATEQPDPAQLSVPILFKESLLDIPDLKQGAEIEMLINVPGYGRYHLFAGRVRNLRASPSTSVSGAQEVTINATGHVTDLENTYISTNWTLPDNRPTTINQAFIDEGWLLGYPTNSQPSADAVYNSIKLMTMLERYVSRYRGKVHEVSVRGESGTLYRELEVLEGTSRVVQPDTLRTLANGAWAKTYHGPTLSGAPSPVIEIPATNVLSDPEWIQGPDNVVTAVKLQVMVPGDDGFTTLQEKNYRAAAAIRNEFGTQQIEVESDLRDAADQLTAANAWMTDDAPWKMDDLTIRDTDEMDPADLIGLLSATNRIKSLLVVTGVMANRPDPGPSDLRSYIIGGEYTWTGEKWEITLRMERTITGLDGEGDWWTCERVAASTNPDIAEATCATVGDRLTVGDFTFIGAP